MEKEKCYINKRKLFIKIKRSLLEIIKPFSIGNVNMMGTFEVLDELDGYGPHPRSNYNARLRLLDACVPAFTGVFATR